MNRQLKLRVALAVAGLSVLASGTALAEEGFYFGLSGGVSMPDLPSKGEFDSLFEGLDFTSSLDDTSEAWGVSVGYRWNSHVALEVGYLDFGSTEYEANFTDTTQQFSVRHDITGPHVSVLGMWPLGERFEVNGRAGILFGDTRIRQRIEDFATGEFLSSETESSSSQDLLAGIGGSWHINESFSLRLEYVRYFDVGDDDQTGELDVDLINFSVLFR